MSEEIKTDAAAKAAQIMQSGQTPGNAIQHPDREKHIVESIDKALADTEAKLAESEPDPDQKQATQEPESEPEQVTTTPEPETKPESAKTLSAREKFAEAARKEAEERAERQETKEWQRKYEETQAELAKAREFQEELARDPLSFYEKHFPVDTYEKLTHLYAEGKKPTPERSELMALRQELKDIKDAINDVKTKTTQSKDEIFINNWFRDVEALSTKDEYKAIHEYAAEVERLTGEPVNIKMAAAKEFDEFLNMYKKHLTPHQVLEILAEKAEERISKYRPETPAKQEEKKPEPKRAKKPAKTLTQSDETESVTAEPGQMEEWAGRDAHLERVAKAVDGTLWSGNTQN